MAASFFLSFPACSLPEKAAAARILSAFPMSLGLPPRPPPAPVLPLLPSLPAVTLAPASLRSHPRPDFVVQSGVEVMQTLFRWRGGQACLFQMVPALARSFILIHSFIHSVFAGHLPYPGRGRCRYEPSQVLLSWRSQGLEGDEQQSIPEAPRVVHTRLNEAQRNVGS